MSELRSRPRLVVITGAPGSGKTTLGTRLSQALQLPFVARDQIRRGLYVTAGLWDATPPDPVPTRRAAPETFLRVLETIASLGVSAIAECTFARDDPFAFGRLSAVADCSVIVTHSARALERFQTRQMSDRLIGSAPVLDALGFPSLQEHTADAIDRMRTLTAEMRTEFDVRTLTVTTDDGYDPPLEDIVAFIAFEEST